MHMYFGRVLVVGWLWGEIALYASTVHEENLTLRAIHEAIDEKLRRNGMKRQCEKTGAIQRQEVRTRSLGISQVPFLTRFLK